MVNVNKMCDVLTSVSNNISHEKRLDVIIKAMGLLRGEEQRAYLAIVGRWVIGLVYFII
jgi:glycosyltransferase involved in cell wall biosynthesis